MGKLQKGFESTTVKVENVYHQNKVVHGVSNVIGTARDLYNIGSSGALLVLSKAWIGIGLLNPSKTLRENETPNMDTWAKDHPADSNLVSNTQTGLNRFKYDELYSLQLGDYFLPMSQTFNLAAKKRFNTSHLVDGIDIIQQTRKEAKTIQCSMRISLRENQNNLKIVRGYEAGGYVDGHDKLVELSEFLQELYETDAVFEVSNDMINNTFKMQHAMISEYKFSPRVGMGTYMFDFALTEVLYGDNVLTFNLREIDADNGDNVSRQISE